MEIPGRDEMQINQQKTIQVDATELRLHIKVRDSFAAGLMDAQGDELGRYEGYVPYFFPGARRRLPDAEYRS